MPGPERAPGPRRLSPGGPAAEADAILATGRLTLLGLMPGASNYTFLVRATHGRDSVLAVYKPRAGETPLWDFPEGTLYRREVAAYELARALGWPAVPTTVARDGPHGVGSVQRLVRAHPDEHFFTMREGREAEFRRVAAFDVVANNADRKAGHCLLGEDGAVWLIDHGVCFAAEPKLRTVVWDYAGERVPAGLVGDLERVAGALRGGPLRITMTALLTPEEVDAAAARAERLAGSGCFPGPAGQRPYPWPLV